MSGRTSLVPGRVYAIADEGRLGARRLPGAIAEMAAAGIETLQLRAKGLPDDELWRLAESVVKCLEGWSGSLWIDDRVDLARTLPFDGVHLGQRDLAPADAREQLPEDRAIGFSTHDEPQLVAAERDPAVDWVALGPIFATRSKEDPDPVVGIGGLARLRPRTRRPLLAIGGIDASNLGSVLAAGADSAVVLSAVCDGDVAANCRRLLGAAQAAQR